MDILRNRTILGWADLLKLVARQEAVIAELRAVSAQQQTVIQGLQQRVTGLEEQLRRKSGGTGMPGNKPAQPRPPERTAVRKVRLQGFGRLRMVPTDWVEHAVDRCPDCGTTLQGGWVQWTREAGGRASLGAAAGRRWSTGFSHGTVPGVGSGRPQAPADLGQAAVGKQRLGVGRRVSLIATLREAGRLPVTTIQWLLATV